MKRLIATLILLAIALPAHARKRVETYVDEHGVRRVTKTHKIYRDYRALADFKRTHPKPSDGHAYDVHHVVPLNKGGTDKPSNMEWIRTEEHRKIKTH